MIGPRARDKWIGLICDASGAQVFAARGSGADASLLAGARLDFDLDESFDQAREALREFVHEHRLGGAEVLIFFTGTGTLVQFLQMPPMSARRRGAAIRTRLTSYSDGRDLLIGQRVEDRRGSGPALDIVAAGVDRRLARGICRIAQQAGLRVTGATPLAAAIGPPQRSQRVVQLVLGERVTAIQLFDQGRPVSSRDVLLGRQDLVAAYQRPIIVQNGAVTLTPEQADALALMVGVPIGQDGDVLPGVQAPQLWPVLSPVLQKLRGEVEQTLAHSPEGDDSQWHLNVLGLPATPGLGQYLASELRLPGPLVSCDHVEAHTLTQLRRGVATSRGLDLRPPEDRFAARMARPAVMACAAALLIMLGNVATPKDARARLSELRPATAALDEQLSTAQARCDFEQRHNEALIEELRRRVRIEAVAPSRAPVVGACKALFASVPAGVTLSEVRLLAAEPPTIIEVRAEYRGTAAASVAAARWARRLENTAYFRAADVATVSGSGLETPAIIDLRITLR